MKNLIEILLCALLLLYCSKESVSKSLSELRGKVIERTQFPRSDTNTRRLQFIAILLRYNNTELTEEGMTFGSATVLTTIHAITSATCVDKYLNTDFKTIKLKFGAFGGIFSRIHPIENIVVHPRFDNDKNIPFANIAIIFLKKPIKNDPENPIPRIPLSLDDFEYDSHVGQVSVHTGEKDGAVCPKVLLTDFHMVHDTDDKTIFHSNPRLNCKIADDGAPIIFNNKLVGITSRVNFGRTDIFTKIYSFLPFIIHQLKLDTTVFKEPPYDYNEWIHDALCIPRLANAKIDEIL